MEKKGGIEGNLSNNRTASILNLHNGKPDFICLVKKDNLMLLN